MENKNNNYVKEALDKIESRKVLLNNKTLEFDNKINLLQNYISDNYLQRNNIIWQDMRLHILNSFQFLACISLIAIPSKMENNNNIDSLMLVFLTLYGLTEVNKHLLLENHNFRIDVPLKDSIRRLSHLSKENKKARKMIGKFYDELENYRKECESKAHEIISNIFSEENMYYDENAINEEIDKAKSIGNNN